MSNLADFFAMEMIFSLASNVDEHYLVLANQGLSTIGNIQKSQIYQSANSTNTETAYANQVVMLTLSKPISYQNLLEFSKALEGQHDRNKHEKPIVTLDIDIIAFKTDSNIENQRDEKNQAFVNLQNQWYGVARRLPLAEYDRVGFDELANFCENLPNLSKI